MPGLTASTHQDSESSPSPAQADCKQRQLKKHPGGTSGDLLARTPELVSSIWGYELATNCFVDLRA
jgi:hypothetical protein